MGKSYAFCADHAAVAVEWMVDVPLMRIQNVQNSKSHTCMCGEQAVWCFLEVKNNPEGGASPNEKVILEFTRRQCDTLRNALAELDKSILRKRSWRQSERAIARAGVKELWDIVNTADPIL